MNQNDILIPAIEDNQQDFFSTGDTKQQENLSFSLDTGGFFNMASQEVDNQEIRSKTPKKNYQEQIQALVDQLKINEEHHAKAVKEYQSILADKDRLVEEKKKALERIHDSHSKRMEQLIRSQEQALTSCQMQHNIEIAKLERQLKHLETQAKGVAVEQLLNNFEQEQHAFPVDCIPVNVSISLVDSKNSATSPTANKNTPLTSPLLRKFPVMYSRKD